MLQTKLYSCNISINTDVNRLIEDMFLQMRNQSANLGVSKVVLMQSRLNMAHLLPHYYDNTEFSALISSSNIPDAAPV